MMSRSIARAVGTLCCLVAVGLGGPWALAQVPSDLCEDAPSFGMGTYNFDTTTATPPTSLPPCATGALRKDVWLKHTAAASGILVVRVCASANTCVSAYDACGGSPLACSRIRDFPVACNNIRRINVPVTAGQTVWVQIFAQTSANVTGTVEFSYVAAPGNDFCTSATPLTLNTPAAVNVIDASSEGAPLCGSASQIWTTDVWFKYERGASPSGAVRVKVCDMFNGQLSLFDSCGGSLMACASSTTTGGCPDERSFVAAVYTGQTIYIRVADSGSDGMGTIELSEATPPANDVCANAIPLTLGMPRVTSFVEASHEGVLSCGHNSAGFAPDVWFKYERGTNPAGVVTVRMCGGSDFSSDITAFDGCGGNPVACAAGSHNSACTAERRFNIQVATNQTIYIRATDTSPVASGTIEVVEQASPASNDTCENAETILLGDEKLIDTTNASPDVVSACAGTNSVFTPFPLNASLWYTYTPTATGRVEILFDSSNSQFGTVTVFDGCGGTELACKAPDGFPPTLRLLADVVQNQPVRIMVKNRDGSGGAAVQGTLKIAALYTTNLVTNDECHEAATLTAGVPVMFNTTTSTTGAAWFSYVPSQTGMALFSGCGSTESGKRMLFAAFMNNCGVLTSIGSNGTQGTRCDGGWMVAPVTAGVPILIRALAVVDSSTPSVSPGSITATEFTPIPNDTCTSATTISSGQTAYNTIAASDSTDNACWTQPTPDAWFRFVPTATGLLNLSLLQRSAEEIMQGMDHQAYSACGQQPLIGCGIFPLVGPPRVGVTVGEPVLIQIRSNYGSAISGLGDRAARGFLSAVYQPLGATEWYEGNTDNAGELPATAQTPTGNGTLTTLMGYYNVNDRVDLYRIRITSPGSFQAAAAPAPTGAGAFFYLFNASGQNLAQGTTLNGAPIAGEYYLAVTPGSMTPVDENLNSLPPSSSGVLADWLGFGQTGIQAYTVTLAGAAVVSPACAADFNGVNGVTVQDIFDFLTAWLAGSSSADFNGVNGVTVQDIFDFLTAWLAGC